MVLDGYKCPIKLNQNLPKNKLMNNSYAINRIFIKSKIKNAFPQA